MKPEQMCIKLSLKQKELIEQRAKELNLKKSEYVRLMVFQEDKLVKIKHLDHIVYVRPEWTTNKGRRRSFFCSNKIWNEMLILTNDCWSVSRYIRVAIIEKMIRLKPEREELFKEMLF